MVQLKLLLPKPFCVAQSYFNSIMVQLKRLNSIANHKPIAYFNSIMVQLKPAVGLMVAKMPAFQFHNSTIKTPTSSPVELDTFYFNSIMVQLKHLVTVFIN